MATGNMGALFIVVACLFFSHVRGLLLPLDGRFQGLRLHLVCDLPVTRFGGAGIARFL